MTGPVSIYRADIWDARSRSCNIDNAAMCQKVAYIKRYPYQKGYTFYIPNESSESVLLNMKESTSIW